MSREQPVVRPVSGAKKRTTRALLVMLESPLMGNCRLMHLRRKPFVLEVIADHAGRTV